MPREGRTMVDTRLESRREHYLGRGRRKLGEEGVGRGAGKRVKRVKCDHMRA